MKEYLSNSVKMTVVQAAMAAGTTDATTSSSVDMSGFDGVMFVCHVGTVTSGGTLVMQAGQSADNSSFAVLTTATATATTGDSGLLLVVDVIKPDDRYVHVILTRATQNVVVNGVVAYQYMAHDKAAATATAQLAATITQVASPDEA